MPRVCRDETVSLEKNGRLLSWNLYRVEVHDMNWHDALVNMKSSPSDQAFLKWIGLAIVIGAAILSNLGVNIQKISHDIEEKIPIDQRRVYYTRPRWILGMILVITASFGDFEALGFAPQALVASVGGGSTVLANLLFAHIWLGQSLSRNDIVGTISIVCGIIISSFANSPDDELSLADLEKQFVHPEFVVYIVIMVVLLICIFAEVKAILLFPRKDNIRMYQRMPFLYATAAGIFGSFSVLLAKCAWIIAELLLLTFQGKNQFQYFTTYLFVGGMLVTLILQTDLLNRAIMIGDTLSVFPVFQCFWIGCSVVSGIVFYQKFLYFSIYEWIALPMALFCIILGIYLLSKHEDKAPTQQRSMIDGHIRFNYGTLVPASPASTNSFCGEVDTERFT